MTKTPDELLELAERFGSLEYDLSNLTDVERINVATALRESATRAGDQDDWRDDPSADERWNAGCEFAMEQLCAVLDIDPKTINWDAATETIDGDVASVIGNILSARFGDDYHFIATARGPSEAIPLDREAPIATQEYVLRAMARNYADGNSWDDLDSLTCVMAADEIKQLRALLSAAAIPAPPFPAPPGHSWHHQKGSIPAPSGKVAHVLNEWADHACNATQWLRNIRDGISSPDQALENLKIGYDRNIALSRQAATALTAKDAEIAEKDAKIAELTADLGEFFKRVLKLAEVGYPIDTSPGGMK